MGYIKHVLPKFQEKGAIIHKNAWTMNGNTGGSKSGVSKLTRTNKKVSTPKGERTVYKGPRGGEYVRLDGKLVPVGKLSSAPKKL